MQGLSIEDNLDEVSGPLSCGIGDISMSHLQNLFFSSMLDIMVATVVSAAAALFGVQVNCSDMTLIGVRV